MTGFDFASLNATDLFLYLQSLGATQRERVRDVAEVWTLGEAEFLVPLKRGLADYARRTHEVVMDLARLQERAEGAVLADVLNVAFDVIRFRLQSAESEDGSLPLSAGVNLVNETRELLSAAACAALEPRALFPNRKPREVNELLEAARLGQTEFGSYVVSLKNPVPPLVSSASLGGGANSLEESDEPLARRATITLLRALDGASTLAQDLELGRTVELQAVLNGGGSANFYESLANLFPRGHACRVQVEVSWATHRPAPVGLVDRVDLDSSASSVWREYGRQLRRYGPLPDYDLAGPIVLLEREDSPQSTLSGLSRRGRVDVSTLVDGKLTRVLVELPDELYSLAIQAHDDRRWLFATGDLQREGRSWRLRYPRQIRFETAGVD